MSKKEFLRRNESGVLVVTQNRLVHTAALAKDMLSALRRVDAALGAFPEDRRVLLHLVKAMQMDGEFLIGEEGARALGRDDGLRSSPAKLLDELTGRFGILSLEEFGTDDQIRKTLREKLNEVVGGASARRHAKEMVKNVQVIIQHIKNEMKFNGEPSDMDAVWASARLQNLNLLIADKAFTDEEAEQIFHHVQWSFNNLPLLIGLKPVLSLLFRGKNRIAKIVERKLVDLAEQYENSSSAEKPLVLNIAEALVEVFNKDGESLTVSSPKVVEATASNIQHLMFAGHETSFSVIKNTMVELSDPNVFLTLKREAESVFPNGITDIDENILKQDQLPQLVALIHKVFATNTPTFLDQRVFRDQATGEMKTIYIGLEAMARESYERGAIQKVNQLLVGAWFGDPSMYNHGEVKYNNRRKCPGASWAITEIMTTVLTVLLTTNGVVLHSKPEPTGGVTNSPAPVTISFL